MNLCDIEVSDYFMLENNDEAVYRTQFRTETKITVCQIMYKDRTVWRAISSEPEPLLHTTKVRKVTLAVNVD